MSSVLAYAVLYKDQWECVRDLAKADPALSVHEGKTRAIIIRDSDETIIADLGSYPDKDYYWITFSVLDEGNELLKRAFSVDQNDSFH